MMKIMKNALKNCRRTHPGKPTGVDRDSASVPGYCRMNRCMNGSPRSPLATATKIVSTRKPIGSSQSRLNHLERPTLTRGAIPLTCGTEPAQVAVSITSSPGVSRYR
jgi:hypothetical protein